MADCSTTGHSSQVHNFDVNGYCHSISEKDVYASFLSFRYIDMVIQDGTADCGLFALASAAALANGEEPGSFVFDQEQMRPHALKQKRQSPFLSRNVEGNKVYCKGPCFLHLLYA